MEIKTVKTFSIEMIKNWKPCYSPEKYLSKEKKYTVLDILEDERIPYMDRLWVILRKELISEKLLRSFALYCAKQYQHLLTNERSLQALILLEKYIQGNATKKDLIEAHNEAKKASKTMSKTAERDAAWIASWATTNDSECAAKWSSFGISDRDKIVKVNQYEQKAELKKMILKGIESGDVY